MSDEGERMCPLCTEEMDLTDQQLKPCKCGYEICVLCWHHIIEMAEKDDSEGRCPACRTPYDKERIVGAAATCERMVAEISSEKKMKPQKLKLKSSEGRKHLSSIRVIQRNLVYVIGVPADLADESTLERKEFFGQYGKVLKVSITRPTGSGQQSSSNGTCTVYITFTKEEEAVRCIHCVHGFMLEGRPLRASFGTTKYCHAWLRNMLCTNPDCLYLHEVGTQENSFTKDELITSYTRDRVQQLTGLATIPQRRAGNVLPPPIDDSNGSSMATPVKMTSKNGSNNPPVPVKSSPPKNGFGRSSILPATASWGTHAMASRAQVNNGVSQSVCKPVSLPALSAVASSTSFLSTLPMDSTKGTGIDEAHEVLLNENAPTLRPSKWPTSGDIQTIESTDDINTIHIQSTSDSSSEVPANVVSSSTISTIYRNPGSGILSRQKSVSEYAESICNFDKLELHYSENELETTISKFSRSPVRSDTASENGATQKYTPASQTPIPAFENGKPDVLFSSGSSDFGYSDDKCLEDVDNGCKNYTDQSVIAVCNGSLSSEPCKVACLVETAHIFPQSVNDHVLDSAKGVFEVDNNNSGPDIENSIISNILSLDLDSCGEILTSSDHLAKMLNESDKRGGSIGFPGSRKLHGSSQSRFSFARDDFVSNPTYSEPDFSSYIVNMQNLSVQPDALDNRSTCGNKYQNGFHHGFEELENLVNSNHVFQSTKSPVARTQITVPPGFSAPSRAPPPGFFSQYSQNRSVDISLGNQLHDTLPLRREFEIGSGSIGNITDVEFIDPAILAVGKGKLPVGLMNSSIAMSSSYSPLANSSENDIRLRMLMQQQSASNHQNFRYGDLSDNRIKPSNDGSFHSRFDGSNLSNFAQMSLLQPRNSHLSNGHWDGWNEAQAGNEFGDMSELLRNVRHGLNKYFSGFDEHKFRISSSGDIYNRAFGM